MSSETIRRLRLGDLQKILRHRYRKNGYKVTDDDAGRDDLYQLLLVVSLGDGHERKMKNNNIGGSRRKRIVPVLAQKCPWLLGFFEFCRFMFLARIG
jgi:hypothetical protein